MPKTTASLLLAIGAVLLWTAISVPASGNGCEIRGQRIRPFDDELLPREQVGGQRLPGLGRLMMLNTYMSPNPADSMRTSFTIRTPSKVTADIKFQVPKGSIDDEQACSTAYQYDLGRMAESGFAVSRRTVVLIPGYRTRGDDEWLTRAADQFQKLFDREINVITVNWEDSNRGIYSTAVSNTIIIARQVTMFLYYLGQLAGIQLSDHYHSLHDVHLVGHSLGAHIAGFVGQDMGGHVGRITGLDPAGPSFDQFPAGQRLDRHDAKLVEVLHTNSGRLSYYKAIAGAPVNALNWLWSDADESEFISSGLRPSAPATGKDYSAWFGIQAQLGHIDYYANDGSEQPGCPNKMHICDHNRATEIFNDLLSFELAMKEGQVGRYDGRRRAQSGATGLMAFRADSYESFEAGESFSLECADFLSATGRHLNQAQQEERRASCAVPLIDLKLPLSELIDELERRHGLDFGHRPPWSQPVAPPMARYYFKTSAGLLEKMDSRTQLLGDHYLLRVYLANSDKFWWHEPNKTAESWCSLHVQLAMENGELALLQLGHLRPSDTDIYDDPDTGRRMQILAMPFVHPTGSRARLQLETLRNMWPAELDWLRRDDEWLLGATWELSNEFSAVFRQLMPRKISLMVVQNGPTIEPKCRLEVRALEVQPLDGPWQGIGALYGSDMALGERLPLTTARELVERLASKFGRPVSSSGGLLVGGGATQSLGVGLEAVLVDTNVP
jgi:pimeloyl-ACP methyl ester carboxylesterase